MDYTRNTMRAAIAALDAVITPAVDSAGQAQAMEQVRLVTDYLRFAEQRMHLVGDREDTQLRAADELADRLGGDAGGLAAAAQLESARRHAESALADRSCGSAVRRRATADLEAALRLVVLEAEKTADGRRRRVETAVLEATKRQIAADRSWLLPLGFDPAPETVPPVSVALGVAACDAD